MKDRPLFREHFFQCKWSYLVGAVLLSISLVLQLTIPILLQQFTDGIQEGAIRSNELMNLAIWFTIVGLGIFVFRSVGRIYIFRMSRRLERDLRNNLFTHWETLPAQYYQKQRIGNLMSHAVNDVNILRQIGMQGVFQMVEAIVLITIAVTMMAMSIHFYLTLLVLLPLPGLTFLAYRFRSKIQLHSTNVQEAIGSLTSRVQEFCSGIQIIKTYVQEKQEMNKFTKDNQHNVEVNKQLIRSNSLFTSLSQGIIGLSYLVSIVYGSILVMKGPITLGEFVAFNTYLSLLIAPIENIGKVINLLQQGKAADKRLRDVLSTEPEIKDEKGVVALPTIKGDVTIRNLSFRYHSTNGFVLKNINITIPKGTTLAIIGKVGSGKSTLVNLLLRLYNPPENTMFIDGHDIVKYPLKQLRTAVSYVPQENFLFSDSIKENIAFDPQPYQDQQVFYAAKQASVYHDITDFPHKFETVMGERGLSLSGGQRQRVSIARALIKASPILILDDSLSAVDSKTESSIIQTLQTEMKDRTVIMISHRISTIKDADQIIVMDQGEIVERGNHQSLVADGGMYEKMYVQQMTELKIGKSTKSHQKTIRFKKRGE